MDKKHQETNHVEVELQNAQNEPQVEADPKQPTPEEMITQFKDQWMRAVAENENLRRRFEKEKEETMKYAVTKFARDILSVSDNMQRALDNAPKDATEELKALIEGIKLVQDECTTIYERHGITTVGAVGEVFNPDLHQSMFEMPLVEGAEGGTIAQVMQVGYTLHGRLLRPALVGVYKK